MSGHFLGGVVTGLLLYWGYTKFVRPNRMA